jgi:hypothetical protein
MKTLINNTMKIKQIALTLLLAIVPMLTFSQSSFDKYEDMDDVSTVVVSKHLFELMAKIEGSSNEAKEYNEMVKNLNRLTVYSTEDIGIAKKMQSDVKKYLVSSNLKELFRVKDKEVNVKIYIKEGIDSDHVSELFMFVYNIKMNVDIEGRKPKAIILSLTGNIDLNKISELATKMKIPGSEHLKKANK